MKGQIALSPRFLPTTGPEFPSTVQQFMSYAAGPRQTAAPTASTVPQRNVNNGKGFAKSKGRERKKEKRNGAFPKKCVDHFCWKYTREHAENSIARPIGLVGLHRSWSATLFLALVCTTSNHTNTNSQWKPHRVRPACIAFSVDLKF